MVQTFFSNLLKISKISNILLHNFSLNNVINNNLSVMPNDFNGFRRKISIYLTLKKSF